MGRANAMFNDNAMKLGLFAPNCRGGCAITTVPERWDAVVGDTTSRSRSSCDEAGIEFLLPIARWRATAAPSRLPGGHVRDDDVGVGLLAQHEATCTVFGTIHAPMIHPIVAAKQMATIDLHLARAASG